MTHRASPIVIVSTTCPDPESARAVARALVEARLAACVQMGPVRSVYRWEGDVVEEAEVAVAAKTTRSCVDRIIETIHDVHSYELPEIVVTDPVHGDPDYLGWVHSECAD